ncbi:hypothetical protein JKP88DRAFT_299521 [Tribonema minus]|uniref:Uncharacterized protein n=1 Tax=Tribonema minus TaxID=303371 RepID=A0A835ZGP1_9STRA|nr:hypothetical protein JKP88DRAFT_299521 [Tribonema minus]
MVRHRSFAKSVAGQASKGELERPFDLETHNGRNGEGVAECDFVPVEVLNEVAFRWWCRVLHKELEDKVKDSLATFKGSARTERRRRELDLDMQTIATLQQYLIVTEDDARVLPQVPVLELGTHVKLFASDLDSLLCPTRDSLGMQIPTQLYLFLSAHLAYHGYATWERVALLEETSPCLACLPPGLTAPFLAAVRDTRRRCDAERRKQQDHWIYQCRIACERLHSLLRATLYRLLQVTRRSRCPHQTN